MRTSSSKNLGTAFVVACIGLLLAGCGPTTSAQQSAIDANTQLQGQVYNNKNNIEFNNYNERQRIADDPTTILWCTIVYANPNVRPITVPIVGKLTSSEKRPYATSTVKTQSDYTPELPGPDHMFGSSAPYRYGFTPAGAYWDFTDVSSTCTTQPTVYIATQTNVVLKLDPQLNAASNNARAALKAGTMPGGKISPEAGAQANQILEQAIASLANQQGK